VNASRAQRRRSSSWAAGSPADRRNQPLFAKIVAGRTHGFGDSIGEQDNRVAGRERDGALFVAGGPEPSKHKTSFLQMDNVATRLNEDGRVVAGVDVREGTRGRIEDAVPEAGEAIGGRRVVDELIQVRHQRGKISRVRDGQGVQRGAQAGHQQGRRNSFSGNVADGKGEAVGREGEEIVIISPDGRRGPAPAGVIQTCDCRGLLRK
jgi:hypothetical protein